MNAKWKDTLERTARTFIQGFLAVVTIDQLTGLDASFLEALYAGAVAGAFAVLMRFAVPPKETKE